MTRTIREQAGRLALLLVVTICVSGLSAQRLAADESGGEALQGLWFGEQLNRREVNGLRRTVLLIRDDQFIVIHPRGVRISKFKSQVGEGLWQIDLDRYDGAKQLGVFRIDKAKLHLTLADPQLRRPEGESVENAGGVPHAHYVFSRFPTAEGIELLKRHGAEIVTPAAAANGADAKSTKSSATD